MIKMADSNFSKDDTLEIVSFGLKILIKNRSVVELQILRDKIQTILPNSREGFSDSDDLRNEENHGENKVDYTFELTSENSEHKIFLNGKKVILTDTEERLLDYFETNLRITVAEFAVGKVFLHAGVVGWKDSAIIIPAKSYQGKTTLVSELIRAGAVYYSDEYAVLDENGLVHPFPKPLSMRGIIDDFTQVDLPFEKFGGTAGERAIPVGMILLTEFDAQAEWNPKILKAGEGIMEILPHTIPIRINPKFTLNTLNIVASRAIIVKTSRGEAQSFAEIILKFFEKQVVLQQTDNNYTEEKKLC